MSGISKDNWHVIIIGAGHAGCEAAAAACRAGAKTILITQKIASIGEMSCNPAMGGIGKGHIIREIDACDGLMGVISDKSAIQYRLLNRSRGPAVQGPRAQIDRSVYKQEMQKYFLGKNSEFQKTCKVVEDSVASIDIEDGIVKGVIGEKGQKYKSKSVVITTGTFLNGCIYLGDKRITAGRIGEKGTVSLANQIASWKSSSNSWGCEVSRLKTGTPPRLIQSSIDWESLEEQSSDKNPVFLSNSTTKLNLEIINCRVTETNIKTHDIIRRNQEYSPVSHDKKVGTSVRYCPSIDDKVIRFADRESHKVYLEPEGHNSNLVYPNGLSTALPEEIQLEFIRSIKGCEKAKISQYGYAIAYDYINPQQLDRNLKFSQYTGLYCAGQINGTTGYEEAGGQGLISGVNAARMALGQTPVSFDRSESYIGVMIDDLVTFGVSEPYRVFTSRSEYRLNLRYDKADHRLTEKARSWGIVGEDNWRKFNERKDSHTKWTDYFKKEKINIQNSHNLTNGDKPNSLPSRLSAKVQNKTQDNIPAKHQDKTQDKTRRKLTVRKASISYFSAFKRPDFNWHKAVEDLHKEKALPLTTGSICRADALYEGYAKRQQKDIDQFKSEENQIIPASVNYNKISGLSGEVVESLNKHRPPNLGAASRLEGVTFGATVALMRFLKGYRC